MSEIAIKDKQLIEELKEEIAKQQETIVDLRNECEEYQKKLDEIDLLALQAGTDLAEIRAKI